MSVPLWARGRLWSPKAGPYQPLPFQGWTVRYLKIRKPSGAVPPPGIAFSPQSLAFLLMDKTKTKTKS